MTEDSRIGVFVCECGLNIAGTVDCQSVADFAAEQPGVAHAQYLMFACSDDGQASIQRAITENSLTGVVVASCTPRTHEPVFRKCIEEAGLNRYLYDQVNIREHVSWVHMENPAFATEKAKHLVAMSIERVRKLEPLVRKKVDVRQNVAVIGAGVAGISAALDLAKAGFETHLIERRPTIGGQMALLDKVFPQNDCAICILGPIMSEVGQHPRIHLHTYSEVEDIDGYVGNFRLTMREKTRYIDVEVCNGCGECEPVCPVSVSNTYEFGIADRKAVYRPFPQAVPNKYTIDKLGHANCRIACPVNVNVQGFVQLLHDGKYAEALDLYRESSPFPGTLGRVCTRPCEEDCERGKHDSPVSIRNLHRFLADYEMAQNGIVVEKSPSTREERIAVVGGGPAGIACASDLLGFGYNVTVYEARKEAGGLLRYGIPQYRLPKEIVQREIQRVKELGVDIRTGTHVESIKDLEKENYDAVFIATGAPCDRKMMIAGEESKGVLHAISFLTNVSVGKNASIGETVTIVGGGDAAIDSARTAKRLGAKKVTIVYRRSEEEMPAAKDEIQAALKEGIKLKVLTTPIEILETDGIVAGIKCVKMKLGEIDESGRRRPIAISGSEFQFKTDTIIIAIGQRVKAEGPHWPLDYNRYGTVKVDPTSLQTSMPGIFAGGDVISGGATVIQAIAEGKRAAKSIDRYIQGVPLDEPYPSELKPIESVDVDTSGLTDDIRAEMPILGLSKRKNTFDEVELGFSEKTALEEASRCLSCAICSECGQCVDACKLEAIDFKLADKITELDVGVIVVATGFKIYDPIETREFGFGIFANVISNAQLERLTNAAGPTHGKIKRPSDGEAPKSVAFIQCVGSRDRRIDQDFCCYVGCENSLKQATQIKEKYPEAEVTIFAMDIRTHGLGYEALYQRAREMGVIIIKGRPSEIEENSDTKSLKVLAEDLYTGMQLSTTYDMVVLASALLPHDDAKELARKLKISTGEYGFFLEAHPKLRPVDAFQDGVFLAGAALGPMDIPKAVAYGKAAAAGAQALLAPGEFHVEPMYAEIDTELCMDCDLCNDMCPYGAITGQAEERMAMFELCQGCGTCAGACPQRAIDVKHYRTDQLIPQIQAAARMIGGGKV